MEEWKVGKKWMKKPIIVRERLENRATVRAGELVKAGAIGRVVQTVGLGPHRITPATRPAWFWQSSQFGGILCDTRPHQADQFLYLHGFHASRCGLRAGRQRALPAVPPTSRTSATWWCAAARGLADIRVDWFTPDGLSTWGDGRLTILGTDELVAIRKNVDIAGRPGESHLFLVDQKETRYIDCAGVDLPYGRQLVDDVLNRTETAMPQAHCYLAAELVLKAQKQAQRLTFRA